MTDALAIAGMLQSFRAITDLGKALLGMRDAALIREKVIELNGEILSAQASALATQADQLALLKRVGELEKEVTDLKAWDAEKQKYELSQIVPGVFAYSLKKEAGIAGALHQICTHCYEDRRKSVLQREIRTPGRCVVLVCFTCGADLYIEGEWHPEHAKQRSGKRPR